MLLAFEDVLLKAVSWIVLVVVILFSPVTFGFGGSVGRAVTYSGPSSQVLQVWFDACPQLTTAYPSAYLFNVAAKTSSGLWITSLHWDFGDGSTLDAPFSGQSQVTDIRAHIYSTQANYVVTVTAYDNAGNTGTVRVSLMPDFTLTPVSPTTQTVTPGGSATYTVNVGSAWCSQIHVDLTTSLSQNPLAGVTWNLSPPSGNTPFTSTLQVQTSTTTPAGTYTISIIGTGAGITHTVTVTLVVIVPYFTISVDPSSLSVSAQVRTNTTTVTIQSFNGFNSPVNLNTTGNPSGMTMSFSPLTVPVPANGVGTSQATITVACSVTPGTYAIQITGRSNNPSQVSNSYVNIKVARCIPPPPPGDWWWLIISLILVLVVVLMVVVLTRDRQPYYYYPR